MTTLEQAYEDVRCTGNALDLAREELAIRQRTLQVAEKDERKWNALHKKAIDARHKVIVDDAKATS